MGKKRTFTEEILRDMYINKDMKTAQMSKILSCGNSTLCRELNKYGLIEEKRSEKKIIKNKRVYRIWQGMKGRCYNKNDRKYKYYGAKKVSVCDEWINSFPAFYNWAIANGYKDNLTIDRINANGDYCEKNCRWVGYSEQNNNKRDNLLLTYNNNPITVKEISKLTGLNESTIRSRLCSGWGVGKIINTPKLGFGKSTVNNKCSSKIIEQYDKNRTHIATFQSIKDASVRLKIDRDSISRCLRGKGKTAGGYIWKYSKPS